MKLYIYDTVERVTDNWHHEGAVVVITDRDPVDAWNNYAHNKYWTDADLAEAMRKTELPKPTLVNRVLDQDTEQVFVFPDAGCC